MQRNSRISQLLGASVIFYFLLNLFVVIAMYPTVSLPHQSALSLGLFNKKKINLIISIWVRTEQWY